MSYREQPTALSGVVLWQQETGPVDQTMRILPDGCLDLIWDGSRLLVAGPDTRFRWHASPAATAYVAIRMPGGIGPALLGMPADELRDRSPALEDLCGPALVRRLTEQVAADPVAALQRWVHQHGRSCPVDPLGLRVLSMAGAGKPVTAMADAVGLGVRQFDRRCLALFGYGPRHLTRVLRLGRALDRIRLGVPLAQVAHLSGYADQAHLSRDVRDLAGTTPGGGRRSS